MVLRYHCVELRFLVRVSSIFRSLRTKAHARSLFLKQRHLCFLDDRIHLVSRCRPRRELRFRVSELTPFATVLKSNGNSRYRKKSLLSAFRYSFWLSVCSRSSWHRSRNGRCSPSNRWISVSSKSLTCTCLYLPSLTCRRLGTGGRPSTLSVSSASSLFREEPLPLRISKLFSFADSSPAQAEQHFYRSQAVQWWMYSGPPR